MPRLALYILLPMLLTATGSFAQVDRSKIPAAGPAPAINIGKYESFTLPNGLKVFVVTNRKLPRVAFNLVLDYDPVLEKDHAGYVSIAGQMLRSGTKTRSKEQLDEEIDFIGASLSTSNSGIYAVSLKKHQDKLLELMADVVLNPSFPQAELERIKKETISEIASQKDDPNAVASLVGNLVLYGRNHPYGEPTTEETVTSITLDQVKKFYNTYYKPNEAYLAIVGDITLAEAKAAAGKYFGNWQKGTVPPSAYTPQSAPAKTKVALVDRPSSVQSVISVTHTIPLKPGPPDAIKARITSDILGGPGGRLYNNLREKRGLTYGAYSSMNPDKWVGEFSAGASVRNAVTDSAIVEFMNELKRIRNEKVTAAELKQSKASVTGSFVRSLESPQTLAGFAINTARYNLPADYYQNYLKNVAAVTAEDVQSTAKKYIRPENAYVVVVGNAAEVGDKLKPFGAIEYYDVKGNKIEPAGKKEVPPGLTADQVLNKYVQAIGGKEKLLAVQDVAYKMQAELPGAPGPVTLTRIQKAPNKFLQVVEIQGMGEVQKTVSDGTKVHQGGMMSPAEDLQGSKLEAALIGNALHLETMYDQYGVKRQLVGMENVNGSDTYKVEFTLPGGDKYQDYYDTQTGLRIRQVRTAEVPQMGTVPITVDFSDYQEVAGVKFPHTLSQVTGPQTIQFKATSIEVNKKPTDEVFQVK